MNTFACDFETLYNDELSVKTLGARAYFDKLTLDDIYMVSVVGDNGFRWVGHPKALDWSFLRGSRALWHNAGFDTQGVRRCRELGVDIPEPAETQDTADLVAYLGLPRALKGAAFVAFGESHDKSIRDKDMKGKGWNDMDPDLQAAVKEYALHDSELCLRLWQKYAPLWPEAERRTSQLTREWAARGVFANSGYIDDRITHLNDVIWKAENDIPWVADGKPPLSKKELAIKCREEGIPCPKSTAIDDEECEAWLDTYGERFPWVMAARDWRRANTIQKKLQAIRVRTANNRFRYDLKYWGAGVTGRFSGAGGVNIQNLSGKELYGVNMRKTLIASPGMKLVASDLSQIEPRCSCWFAGETEAMAEMAAGVSPYIVYARQAMGLAHDQTWEKTDTRYKVAKESVLGCGYSMGHHKFLVTIEGKVPKGLMKEEDVKAILDAPLEFEDCEEQYFDYIDRINRKQWRTIYENHGEQGRHRLLRSWEIVTTFRTGRPELVALWRTLGDLAKQAAARAEDLEIGLPSGRSLVYKKCRFRRRPKTEENPEVGHDVVCDITRNGVAQTTRIHSGILIENLCVSGEAEVLKFPGVWVRLASISGRDLLWDGGQWVSHGGLIAKGDKSTINVAGVKATEDHLFLTETGWEEAKNICNSGLSGVMIPEYDQTKLDRKDNRGAAGSVGGPDKEQGVTVASEVLLRKHEHNTGERPHSEEQAAPILLEGVPPVAGAHPKAQNSARNEPPPSLCSVELDAFPMPEPNPSFLAKLRWTWDYSMPDVDELVRCILGGHGANLPAGAGSGPCGQQPRLLQAKLPVDLPEQKLPEQAERVEEPDSGAPGKLCGARKSCRSETLNSNISAHGGGPPRSPVRETGPSEQVFDILDCGPNNCFVVRGGPGLPPIIAHNCQAMARDAFRDCLLRVHDAGYKVLFHVHDEVVVESPSEKAEETRHDLERLMGIRPAWAPNLPVAAEASVADSYDKAK